MPTEYPVEQLMADLMAAFADNIPYIIPAAILCAVVSFILQWFFYAVDIGGWTFGRRK